MIAVDCGRALLVASIPVLNALGKPAALVDLRRRLCSTTLTIGFTWLSSPRSPASWPGATW